MDARFTAERVLLAVLALGMASFVALHGFVLLQGGEERTMSLVRTAWFAGLVVLVVAAAFLSMQHRSAT